MAQHEESASNHGKLVTVPCTGAPAFQKLKLPCKPSVSGNFINFECKMKIPIT